MYLTRVALDTANRKTMKALVSPSILHGALESSFLGERKRNLWRLDNLNGQLYIIILSEDKPDLTEFCKQFSYESIWETVDYDRFLSGIKNGSCKRFRLTANPTVSVCKNKGERGRVYAHITSEHQREWLIKKSTANGFIITQDSFDVVQSKWKRFYKAGSNSITMLSVTYEGVLEITNEDLFRNALVNGIGRGKAYGMGLITVMNIGGET